MLQKIIQGFRDSFGLDRRSFRFYLVNIGIFLLIGLFVRAKEAESSTYLLAAFLMVANSLVLFALQRDVVRIKLAALTSLVVLNAAVFGYYYFSSISIFF